MKHLIRSCQKIPSKRFRSGAYACPQLDSGLGHYTLGEVSQRHSEPQTSHLGAKIVQDIPPSFEHGGLSIKLLIQYVTEKQARVVEEIYVKIRLGDLNQNPTTLSMKFSV